MEIKPEEAWRQTHLGRLLGHAMRRFDERVLWLMAHNVDVRLALSNLAARAQVGAAHIHITRHVALAGSRLTHLAASAGMSIPGVALAAVPQSQDGVRWDKGVCRYCGTGCGVLVGVRDGRVVATQGDPDAPVNRGLNCIKGYFLSKIQYGKDRLTRPMLRMKNGRFDKNGEFQPISWKQALDIMEEKCKAALKVGGPRAIGMFGSGQWTIWEGYAAAKLFKAGFRSNNLDPNARHCMASAVAGFMRTFGADEPMGCYDDIEAAVKSAQGSTALEQDLPGLATDRLKEAAKLGFSMAVVPRANLPKNPASKDYEGLTIHAVERVEQAMEIVRSL